jgi:putative membrane protein
MSKSSKTKRTPRAFAPDDPHVITREMDAIDPELTALAPPDEPHLQELVQELAAEKMGRRLKWGGIFLTALGGLIILGAGLWLNDFVSGLFVRQDWIGWSALALLATACLAAAMIALREFWALLRLRRLSRVRADADTVLRQDDEPLATRVAAQVKKLYRSRDELAWGRARLADHEGDIMDARETLALTERELVAPLDSQASTIIAGTAQRVSVITAVSPVAVLDMAVVAAQNLRMLRRIATLYGARPGFIGLLRLARMVVTHIVLTGGIALGDDLIQQLIGHRLMAKLSARLGEGLFNGALTARIGLAALDVCRPLPFVEASPPRLRNLVAEIARQAYLKI